MAAPSRVEPVDEGGTRAQLAPMLKDDWLERQIRELGRALAALFGSHERQAVDAELEGLLGVRLDVLRAVPPSMVVKLIGERYGEFRPERVFSAIRILDVELAVRPDPALALRRTALVEALISAVGDDGLASLERALTDERAGSNA